MSKSSSVFLKRFNNESEQYNFRQDLDLSYDHSKWYPSRTFNRRLFKKRITVVKTFTQFM